jgi:hypothetical protein
LAYGIDPDTGKELPPDVVSNRPDVLRALLAGVAALEAEAGGITSGISR